MNSPFRLSAADTVITSAQELVVGAGQRAFVQNLGMEPLKVKMGEGASATSFHFVLPAGEVDDDGTGGATSGDSPLKDYVGVVSFYSESCRYVAWVK